MRKISSSYMLSESLSRGVLPKKCTIRNGVSKVDMSVKTLCSVNILLNFNKTN